MKRLNSKVFPLFPASVAEISGLEVVGVGGNVNRVEQASSASGSKLIMFFNLGSTSFISNPLFRRHLRTEIQKNIYSLSPYLKIRGTKFYCKLQVQKIHMKYNVQYGVPGIK